MIRLDNISKQHGKQILFLEASAAVNRGEKVGLVGPNGAGKSTIFKMIMKQEIPDDGTISIDKGVRIGYFSQDVGEMGGKPVVAETMDGAGPVSDVARELKELEQALGDPERADELAGQPVPPRPFAPGTDHPVTNRPINQLRDNCRRAITDGPLFSKHAAPFSGQRAQVARAGPEEALVQCGRPVRERRPPPALPR